ncbi:hypothetical protein EYF80_024037 [Liparis tanakae]|uniref:Uncharacterized protein n=1 Tax=Liparis tanakae TaxID=230148 RepID=A0A4Z2HLB4_9TELE|nr:hypothetical protein EYF80_024037 [Liparis tanakae]
MDPCLMERADLMGRWCGHKPTPCLFHSNNMNYTWKRRGVTTGLGEGSGGGGVPSLSLEVHSDLRTSAHPLLLHHCITFMQKIIGQETTKTSTSKFSPRIHRRRDQSIGPDRCASLLFFRMGFEK